MIKMIYPMNQTDLQQRIRNALIIITDNKPFKVGDLIFNSKDDNHIEVIGLTVKNTIESLTNEFVLIELQEIKTLFSKMVNISIDLESFIKNRQIKYSLIFNYGMGSLEICSETNGIVEWQMELNK